MKAIAANATSVQGSHLAPGRFLEHPLPSLEHYDIPSHYPRNHPGDVWESGGYWADQAPQNQVGHQPRRRLYSQPTRPAPAPAVTYNITVTGDVNAPITVGAGPPPPTL
jgi:hypothetical protein